METNEAPEKIFLEWYRIGDKEYRDWCITPKTNNEPVEYTRTDVFIEKACKAFCKVCKMPNCNSKDCSYLKNFRNHMKGE